MPPATSRAQERRRRTPPTSRPPTIRVGRSGTGAAPRASRSSPRFHLEYGEKSAQPYGRHHGGQHDRDHADGGCLPDVETLKSDEIEQEREVGSVRAGAAVGQHVDRVEGLYNEK